MLRRTSVFQPYRKERVHAPGIPIQFQGYSNYPDWISRAELIIKPVGARKRGSVLNPTDTTLPVAPDGSVTWYPDLGYEGDLVYSYRVYDSRGAMTKPIRCRWF